LEHLKQNRIFIYQEKPILKTINDYLYKNIFADKDFFSNKEIPLEFDKILGIGIDLPKIEFEKEIKVDLSSPTEQIPEIFQKPLTMKKELSKDIPKLDRE
jgi:hypothetical protein